MYILKVIAIYIGLLISYCLSLISIAFKSINLQNSANTNFYQSALSNEIYINLTLSNPVSNSNINIKTLIKIDKNSFFLPQSLLSSSKNINKEKRLYISWLNSMFYFANDSFSFNIMNNIKNSKNFTEKKSYNFLNFLTKKEIDSYEIYNNYGIIGLKLISNENDTKYPDFIKELKEEKLIKNYKWSIKYNYINMKMNYFEGEFLLGDEIDNYWKKNIIDYYHFRMIKAYNRENELYWDLKFKDILINGKSIDINNNKYALQGTFEPKLNLIIGTNEFRNSILNQFFNNYIYKKICYEEKIIFSSYNYIGLSCIKNFNASEFPNIWFKLQFYTFVMNSQDLFYEDKEKGIYHFLIIFNNDYEENSINLWTFGVPFMNKYIFIFESDQKLIQYYEKGTDNYELTKDSDTEEEDKNSNKENDINNSNTTINNNNNININRNKQNFQIFIFLAIGIILCLSLILFGMKIQRIVIKKRFPNLNLNRRKKHKNELSCELEQINKDDNLLISS